MNASEQQLNVLELVECLKQYKELYIILLNLNLCVINDGNVKFEHLFKSYVMFENSTFLQN